MGSLHRSHIRTQVPNVHQILDALTDPPPADASEHLRHEDLPRMSSAALWRELTCMHLHLALDKDPRWRRWFVERDRRVRKELRFRGVPT